MIQLEKFDSSCYSKLISWIGTAEDLMQFAGPGFSFPLTVGQLEEAAKNENRVAFKVSDSNTGLLIGHAEIYKKEHVAILCRILIGDKQMRGNGIGGEIVRQLVHHSFVNLGYATVELNVYDWNTDAIKCYERAGFIVNRNKVSHSEVNGKTWTAINMKLDKADWPALTK
jgi:RimJ/RimL family protein N-acetyltransferase